MLALFAAAAWAATGGQTYGTSLLERELERHRQLTYASIDLEPPASGHFEAGTEIHRASKTTLSIADGLGERIGTLTLESSRAVQPRVAAQIANDIARHVYSKTVLGEADPFTHDAFRSLTGAKLVEKELRREPALVTIAFHVALPGKANQIIASNFGRIGKPADADDQRVIATSTDLQEVTNGGKRLAVELPLLDSSGRTLGALSTSFTIGPEGRAGAYRSALRVQHDLAHSIAGLGSLAR